MKLLVSLFRQMKREGNSRGRFLVYFMIVNLLAAGTVGTLLYISTSGAVRRQTEEANQNLLIQLSKSTDMLLNQVVQYMDQIPRDRDVVELSKYLNKNDVLSLVNINDKMSNIIDTNNYIYEIAIYYGEQERLFVINDGVIELEDYDYRDILLSNIKYPAVTRMAPSSRVPDKNNPNRFTNVISIIKPVQTNGIKPTAYVMVLIEDKFFRNILDSILDSNNIEIYITNDEADIVAKNTGNGKYRGILSGDIALPDEENIASKVVAYNSEKVLVSSVTSRTYGWKYISAVSYDSVNSKTQIVKSYSVLVSFLAIFLGVFASFFFSKKISSPINKIVQLFNNSESVSVKGTDVFGYIEKNVNTLVRNKENIEKLLNDHMPVLRNNYLADILFGNITDPAEMENRFDYYGINLGTAGSYLVYVVSMWSDGSLSVRYTERQINMLIVYLMGVIDELINRENRGIVINTRPNELAVVLELPKATSREDMKQKVEMLGGEIQKSILENISCTITMAVGGTHHDIGRLYLSYEEALEALEYSAFYGGGKVIFYEEVKKIREKSYSYPFKLEESLLRSLRKGKADEVAEKNRAVFKAFTRTGNADKGVVYYMQLLGSTIRYAYETGMNMDDRLDENNLYNEILSCNCASEAQAWFERLFASILEFTGNRKDTRNRSVIEAVESYIRENIEKDLSLTALSEMVYMSANYFSKIFKEKTGKSVKHYINEVRIEKAKEFLRKPEYKISEVAEAVGYDKMNAFLYFFKESTGMTPGEYRASILKLK